MIEWQVPAQHRVLDGAAQFPKGNATLRVMTGIQLSVGKIQTLLNGEIRDSQTAHVRNHARSQHAARRWLFSLANSTRASARLMSAP